MVFSRSSPSGQKHVSLVNDVNVEFPWFRTFNALLVWFALLGIKRVDFNANTLSCRYGGFSFGMPLPPDLQLDIRDVPKNRTLSKVSAAPKLFSFTTVFDQQIFGSLNMTPALKLSGCQSCAISVIINRLYRCCLCLGLLALECDVCVLLQTFKQGCQT